MHSIKYTRRFDWDLYLFLYVYIQSVLAERDLTCKKDTYTPFSHSTYSLFQLTDSRLSKSDATRRKFSIKDNDEQSDLYTPTRNEKVVK
jgi:hypothetical protein